jgi:two-component system sensor histidine kinase GlrK
MVLSSIRRRRAPQVKITTRIAAGLFLIAGLLIGALAYQLSVTDRLQGINRELSLANIESAQISIRLIQGIEGVREFADKWSVLRDSDNLNLWAEWESSVKVGMAELAMLDLGGEEAAFRSRIEADWSRYREAAGLLAQNPDFPFTEVEASLNTVRDEINALIAANRVRVTEHAESSAQAGEKARMVAWIAAIASLLLAGAISIALFASISGPLRRLTHGTRELARGRFEHRLKVSGPAELALLAGDFNHMAARLSELEDLKREFVSHVSHELKTPLAAIQETIEVFLEGIPGPLTPTQERLLNLSRKSSTRLSGMITNLLEASRIEAGAAIYNPAPHDLNEIAASVLEETAPLALERGISLVSDSAPGKGRIVCDGDRIRDVVTNLVGNAIKFAPDGSTVRVSIQALDRPPSGISASRLRVKDAGPFLLLSVEDEGTGVPDQQKEAIFEKFHQVGGQGRIRGQGVGLGLAISRKIVHGHSGAIWVDDRVGGGAIFRVLLPSSPQDLRGEQQAAPSPSVVHRKNLSSADSGAKAMAPRRGVTSAGSSAILVAFLSTAGCSALPLRETPPAPEPHVLSPTENPVESDIEANLPETSEVDGWLADGRIHFEARAFQEASGLFERVVAIAPTGSAEWNEALWGLALTRLLPESPLYNLDRGTTLLRTLAEESPGDYFGLQATLLRQSLLDHAEARRLLRERDAQVEELTRALELYRRIDLERRPAP